MNIKYYCYCVQNKKKYIKFINELKEYININYKFPDTNHKLYHQYNYYIDELEDFRNEYCYYFDNEEIYYNLSNIKLENYIKENNTIPTKTDINILICHMAYWMEKKYNNIADKKFKNKLNELKEYINKNKKLPINTHELIIYYSNKLNYIEKKLYNQFKNDYSFYLANIKYILLSLNKLESYIEKNNILPKKSDSDIFISHLSHWMYKKLYKCKFDNNEYYIIHYYYNNEIIKNKIDDIYNKYSLLFKINNSFTYRFQDYIYEFYTNNYLIYNEELINWYNINYKRYYNEEMTLYEHIMFKTILKLNNKSELNFYIQEFNDNLNKLKKYINENQKILDNNHELMIYLNNKELNNTEKILFNQFKLDYSFYFDEDVYIFISVNKLKTYIHQNNKLPKKSDSNIEISHMAYWLYNKVFYFENNKLYIQIIYYCYLNKTIDNNLLFKANNDFILFFKKYNNNIIKNKELIHWYDINYNKYINEELSLEEYFMFESILQN
jgi:hypothetical protein